MLRQLSQPICYGLVGYLALGLALTIYVRSELRDDPWWFYLAAVVASPVLLVSGCCVYLGRMAHRARRTVRRGHWFIRNLVGMALVVVIIALYALFFAALQQ